MSSFSPIASQTDLLFNDAQGAYTPRPTTVREGPEPRPFDDASCDASASSSEDDYDGPSPAKRTRISARDEGLWSPSPLRAPSSRSSVDHSNASGSPTPDAMSVRSASTAPSPSPMQHAVAVRNTHHRLQSAIAAVLFDDTDGLDLTEAADVLCATATLTLNRNVNDRPLMAVPRSRWQHLFALMPHLEHVDLHHVDAGVPVFLRMVFAGLPLEQLTRLTFVNVPWDEASMESLLLQTPRMAQLRHLVLPDAAPQQTLATPAVSAMAAAPWAQALRRLVGPGTNAAAAHMALPAHAPTQQFFHSLHHLSALRTFHWPMQSFATMPISLTENQRLISLQLRGDWDSFVRQGLLPQGHLKELNLSHCQLTAESAQKLTCASWAPTLRVLDVSENPQIGLIDLSAFVELTHLNLKGSIKPGGTLQLPGRGTAQMAADLENVPCSQAHKRMGASAPSQLSHVNLATTGLHQRLSSVVNLFDMPNLLALDLEHCNVTAQDLTDWSTVVPEDHGIKQLRLGGNPLGLAGLVALKELPLRELEVLGLQEVGIKMDGAVELARGGGLLARWPKLKQVAFGELPDANTRAMLQAITELPDGTSLSADC